MIFILTAVILPTFVVITIVENQLTRPVIEQEILQGAIAVARGVRKEIENRKFIPFDAHERAIERMLQETLYSEPNLIRIDLLLVQPPLAGAKIVASTVEEDPGDVLTFLMPEDRPEMRPRHDLDPTHAHENVWEVQVPIRNKKGVHFGAVSVLVSMRIVENTLSIVWRMTAIGAVVSVFFLVLGLSVVMRRMISADRLLRRAESQNLVLSSQLQEAQRELMNQEKLAVMGQLTASFAHEIGTPLNAIGGHLQLLKDDLEDALKRSEKEDSEEFSRFSVIEGQLQKIETIVKNFLQSTAKPVTQTQLSDVNRLVDQSLGILAPRCQSLGVEVRRELDRSIRPLRIVPIELEQVLLNLVNNSLDSLKSKLGKKPGADRILEIQTRSKRQDDHDGVLISVYDTGEGISKIDITKVLKPFFTTKAPGEGTGLGLPICRQIVQKYGGELEVHSKESVWTRVDVWIPFS